MISLLPPWPTPHLILFSKQPESSYKNVWFRALPAQNLLVISRCRIKAKNLTMTYINQWWLAPLQVPTRIPSLGCDEENYSVQTAQLTQQGFETAGPWNSTSARQPWDQVALVPGPSQTRQLCFVPVSFAFLSLAYSTLFWWALFCAVLLWLPLVCSSETSSAFQLRQVDSVFSGKGKCILPRGSWLI